MWPGKPQSPPRQGPPLPSLHPPILDSQPSLSLQVSTGSPCAPVTVAGLYSAQGLLSHKAFGFRLETALGGIREILKEGEGDPVGTGACKDAIGDILQAGGGAGR